MSKDARSHSGSLTIYETWCCADGVAENACSWWPLCRITWPVGHARWIISMVSTGWLSSWNIWNWLIPLRFSRPHAIVSHHLADRLIHLGSILHWTNIKTVILRLRRRGCHSNSRCWCRSSWRYHWLRQRHMWPWRHHCAHATNQQILTTGTSSKIHTIKSQWLQQALLPSYQNQPLHRHPTFPAYASSLHTHTHNRFTALWNLSGKTRVSRYQKNIHPLLSS